MPNREQRVVEIFDDLVGRAIGNIILFILVKWWWWPLAALVRRLRPTAQDQELMETVTLHTQAVAAYKSSFLSTTTQEDQAVEMIRTAIGRAEDPLPALSVLTALCEATEELMTEEGWSTVPALDQARELPLESAMLLRNYLRRQHRLFHAAPELMPIWSEKMVCIASGLMTYLPPRIDGEDEAHQLEAPLIDLSRSPVEMMERLIGTFFDDDLQKAGLFEDMRERLEANALRASGIDPAERHRTHRAITLPRDMRHKTPTELVELYLAGTPFERFFLSEFPFAIPQDARFEHCHILGGTGHGKTQLLQQLIHHDLLKVRDGEASLVVIDSQGDLIRKIAHLAYFNPALAHSLADHIMLIDPNDIEFPVGLNMFDVNQDRLHTYSALEREKILNGTIELYEYIFGALLGAELTQKQGVIFRYLARLMLSIPNATVQTLRELMEDGRPFKPYMEQLEGTSRRFFETQFFEKSFASTKTQILRRLWGVLSNTTFERMFSNPHNKIDLFEAMNSGKVILINTAKDLLKQEGCEIFGRFFIAMIVQAALQRSVIDEEDRLPTYVFVDEAHDYLDERAEVLFNQARKYKVAVHVAHQNLNQLSRGLEASIMASTSIKLAGGMSAKDASTMAREMQCEPEFLRCMKKRRRHTEFACWIKNTTPQPIRLAVPLGFLEGLPRLIESEYESLVAENRARYCVSREEVEEALSLSTSAARSETDNVQGIPSEPQQTPPTERPRSPPATRPASEVPPPPAPPHPPTVEATAPLGRGGRDHKYLQQLVMRAAQDHGFHTTIEEEILDGAGRVDVALAQGDTRIAFEISVNSPPKQELHNVEKCIAAHFDQVVLVCATERHLRAVRRYVLEHVDEAHQDRIQFLLPEGVLAHIETLSIRADGADETIRGYKVKVTHKAVSPEERAARRHAIAGVIRRSLKHLKGDD